MKRVAHRMKSASQMRSAYRMRIAHVTSTFPPYYGGTGTVCYHNALGAAAYGHNVHVFTARGALRHPAGQIEDPPGVTVHRLMPLLRLGNAPCLPQLLNLRGFDVVHLHSPFPFGEELLFLQSLLRRTRYVITYHQDLILPGWLGKVVKGHWDVLGQRILGHARRLMVTSRDYAQASRITDLVAKMGERVVEMPNGIDIVRFHPGVNGQFLRERYDLERTDRVILFVGALDQPHYFKGVEVLLRALDRIALASVKLVVVGDGDLRPQYQVLARRLGVEARVRFCGRVSDVELPAHYALGDVLVLPSTTMGEAFGIVLLEAMACGKPVIASNLPGVRSVVKEGEDGFLVTPGDEVDLAETLQGLLEQPDVCRAMGQQGRAKVEARYAWSRIIPKLMRVYEDVACS